MRFIDKLFLFSLAGMLTSCSNTVLNPNAERVAVVTAVPKNCQFRGNVDSGTSHQRISSHENIHRDQTNIMKNQAVQLGANTIYIVSHKIDYYSNYIVSSGDSVREIQSHQMSGRAYYCK